MRRFVPAPAIAAALMLIVDPSSASPRAGQSNPAALTSPSLAGSARGGRRAIYTGGGVAL